MRKKLLLLLEHRFFRLESCVFCERIISYDYLKRYLSVFDSVTVCGRFTDNISQKRNKVSGAGVDFLELPDFQGLKGLLRGYFCCSKIIKQHLQEFDAVIVRTPSPISFFAYPVLKKSKLPYAIELVINPKTMFSKDSYPSKFQPLISYMFTKHTEKICMNANGVAYVTERVLQNMYPCRAMVVRNDMYFTASYSTINLKNSHYNDTPHRHIINEPYVISHTGYMDTYSKGHLAVINTVSMLIKRGLNCLVYFIGSGNLQRVFEKYAQEMGVENNVVFLGNINNYTEIQCILKKTDVFLFPTSSEGLPRSLIEAMANSVACVSSPVDGIVELLDHKYLVDYKDYSRMCDVVYELLINDKLRHAEAIKNYRIAKRYSADILSKKRNEFYSKLCKLIDINKHN